MHVSNLTHRRIAGLAAGLLFIAQSASIASAAGLASDATAAIRAVATRTNLPPEADDPERPAGLRLLKPGVWTDDIGIDDNGNPYNQYRRSTFGTWSNYSEARANPFPLPDPLRLKSGRFVLDAVTWWKERRPEILEDFLAQIYGRIPVNTPAITWEVTAVAETATSKTKTIIGHIDNSSHPEAHPAIRLTLILPANASGPVPVIVMVGGGGGSPRPSAPPSASAAPSGARVPPPDAKGPSPTEQILARGWGCAFFSTGSVQADNAAGLTEGIIGLVNQGRPRSRPDEWGALSAWAWGLSRSIDYFETDPAVDPKRLGVEGHSRWGKTALWATALDQRWAIVYASCSGEGGAKLSRRNFGETVDNIAGSHWMAENFRKYGGNWNALPVDAHELIALVAPRPAFITGATQDPWSDPGGEFQAVVAAGPVYRLLGKQDVGATEMPAPNVALVSGELAFREHVGAHTDVPDWPVFLEYAAKYFGATTAKE
jgi:hypothetical protein